MEVFIGFVREVVDNMLGLAGILLDDCEERRRDVADFVDSSSEEAVAGMVELVLLVVRVTVAVADLVLEPATVAGATVLNELIEPVGVDDVAVRPEQDIPLSTTTQFVGNSTKLTENPIVVIGTIDTVWMTVT